MEKLSSLHDLSNWKVADLPDHQVEVKNHERISQKPDDIWARELLDTYPEKSPPLSRSCG